MAVKSFILKPGEFTSNKKFVNKFLPLERVLNLLNTKAIWFSNPECWPDPFEKRFICAKYGGKQPFAWKGRVFCSCFTDNATSEASWKAYSNGEICIQVTFKRQVLLDLLEAYAVLNPHKQVFFDSVEYMRSKCIEMPLSKIPFDPPLAAGVNLRTMEFKARLLLLKRKAFLYENEFRAIVVKEKATKEAGILVPIPDVHQLIERITIGPTVQEDTFNMLKDMFVTKFGFAKNKVWRSYLYKTLPSNINIK